MRHIDISELDDSVYNISESIQLVFDNDKMLIMTDEDCFHPASVNEFQKMDENTYVYMEAGSHIVLDKKEYELFVDAVKHYFENKI